jgi:hypothetical protein
VPGLRETARETVVRLGLLTGHTQKGRAAESRAPDDARKRRQRSLPQSSSRPGLFDHAFDSRRSCHLADELRVPRTEHDGQETVDPVSVGHTRLSDLESPHVSGVGYSRVGLSDVWSALALVEPRLLVFLCAERLYCSHRCEPVSAIATTSLSRRGADLIGGEPLGLRNCNSFCDLDLPLWRALFCNGRPPPCRIFRLAIAGWRLR